MEQTIRPAIAAGQWVLSDRFVDSSIAYQGGGLGLGEDSIRALHGFGSEDFLPDRTLVLTLGEGEGRGRAESRDGGASDRIGGRDAVFHRAVDEGFRVIAAEEPGRMRLIDASGSEGEVTARLLAALDDLL